MQGCDVGEGAGEGAGEGRRGRTGLTWGGGGGRECESKEEREEDEMTKHDVVVLEKEVVVVLGKCYQILFRYGNNRLLERPLISVGERILGEMRRGLLPVSRATLHINSFFHHVSGVSSCSGFYCASELIGL